MRGRHFPSLCAAGTRRIILPMISKRCGYEVLRCIIRTRTWFVMMVTVPPSSVYAVRRLIPGVRDLLDGKDVDRQESDEVDGKALENRHG